MGSTVLAGGPATRLDLTTPLEQASFAVVDIESTGGSLAQGDRICEIALVRGQAGHILDQWSSLIQPDHPMNGIVAAKTGIRDTMLQTAPRFPVVVAIVQRYLQQAVLVAHGATFDTRFLRYELDRAAARFPFPAVIIDTLQLAQAHYALPSYKLADIGASLQLPAPQRAHRALPDALLTWAILWQIVTDLRARGLPLRTVGDLVAAQNAPPPRPAPPPARRSVRGEPAGLAGHKQQLAEQLCAWLQPWSQVPAEIDVPLPDCGIVADVCFTYPMGWRLVYQTPQAALTPQDLATTTRRLQAAGIDVVWWLGAAADTPANQHWCRTQQGWRGWYQPDTSPAFHLARDQYGYEYLIDGAEPDHDYTRHWRHLALVRYLELWRRVRVADFLRGMAGTAQLGRSVTGIIGAANTRSTLQKRGDAWYPATLTPFYRDRIQPWPAATVAAVRALARQRQGMGALPP